MVIKKTIKINVIGNLPISLEGAQLAIENSERLFSDSQNVSTPTKIALLEIGLEEIAKAWGIILGYESNNLRDPNFRETFIKKAHIKKNKIVEKRLQEKIKAFSSENNAHLFMMPFDTKTFTEHKNKIEFLSKFIEHIRDIELPLIREASDRDKMIREILGRYISKNKLLNLQGTDKIIDNILNVDTAQFNDILAVKEHGLYLDVQNNTFISPSARSFDTDTLENLLDLLIGVAKNEITLLLATLRDMPKSGVKMADN